MTKFHEYLELYVQPHEMRPRLRVVENVVRVPQLSHLAREQRVDEETSVLGSQHGILIQQMREVFLGRLKRLLRANLVERRQDDVPMLSGYTLWVFPQNLS